jgi:sulfoxide reductase heme-binding subunit YedZ
MAASVNPQVWWWLARASGIVAWCMATASIVWGLTLSSKLVRRRKVPAWLLDLHKYLGTLTLAFAAVHLVALLADNYVDFGLRDLFVPMASAWRPGAVTWGVVALYLLLVVQVSSWLMRRIPRRLWHRIHLLSFAVFAAGTIHGALAGADSGTPLVQFAAVAGTTIIVFLVFVRILNASGTVADDDARPRDARAAAAAARAARAEREEAVVSSGVASLPVDRPARQGSGVRSR